MNILNSSITKLTRRENFEKGRVDLYLHLPLKPCVERFLYYLAPLRQFWYASNNYNKNKKHLPKQEEEFMESYSPYPICLGSPKGKEFFHSVD